MDRENLAIYNDLAAVFGPVDFFYPRGCAEVKEALEMVDRWIFTLSLYYDSAAQEKDVIFSLVRKLNHLLPISELEFAELNKLFEKAEEKARRVTSILTA